MADKTMSLGMNVYELCKLYPEAVDIMLELGFDEITAPGRLNTIGRIMTLEKASKVKGIALEKIVEAFQAAGFEVEGYEADNTAGANESATDDANKPVTDGASNTAANVDFAQTPTTPEARQAQLEQLVRRLSAGEALESVRKDFVRDFASVSSEEIARAEQNLISGGMPVEEVQQLCDVHSALFHGKTDGELCAMVGAGTELAAGHPVSVMQLENEGLIKVLDEFEPMLKTGVAASTVKDKLTALKALKKHYGKKEELLMPLLYNYGFTGPSDVMWGVDDEIVHETSALVKEITAQEAAHEESKELVLSDELLELTQALVTRMREMVYKEEQIFFPLALEHLTQEEWYATYRDLEEFGWAFIEGAPAWIDADVWLRLQADTEHNALLAGVGQDALEGGKIKLPTGELTLRELTAILKLVPVDLTFIDANEITRFFTNEGKVFARPLSCLNREVWSCHPPRLIPMIQGMIAEFKAGNRDFVEMWTPSATNPVRVQYFALRDDDGSYLGTLEVVQQFGDVLESLATAADPSAKPMRPKM